MGGYAIFLGPIAGIMCSDFFIVKKQKIDIPALYDPQGRYRYWYGTNWRALLAFLLSFVPNFPGLIKAVVGTTGSSKVHISNGAQHLYKFSWLYGFVAATFVYAVLNLLFPEPEAQVAETITSIDSAESHSGSDMANEKVPVVVGGDVESLK